MSEGLDDDLVREADGFDDPEIETSPEVVRSPAAGAPRGVLDPLMVVCSPKGARRRALVDLLTDNGWQAIEVKTSEELIETSKAIGPDVVLVDASLQHASGLSVPEAIQEYKPDAPRRVIALLDGGQPDLVAGAVVDGYDDFILDPDNHVEVLARTTANLRACRTMSELQRQRRDADTLLELSQTLASSLDLQLILHTVSRLIADVLDLERCSIIILDPDSASEAVMVAASEDRAVRDLRIDLRNYPELEQCVDSAGPVIIEDPTLDPLLEKVREKTAAANLKMMALFPIIFEERVTGVLFLRSHRATRSLTDHEVRFGQTVASACAVAIRNARLFDSFRDQHERINYMRLVAERQMEALKKYEDFFEYAADGMAIVDTNAEILYVNREGRRLLGREREEVRGRSFVEFLADESRDRWAEVADLVRLGRFSNELDFFILRPDNTERIFSLSAGGGGQETGLVILSFRDVTETREMEMELRTTKDFLENLIDNSVDAICAADMSGNIMLFNKGAEEVFGYRSEDVIGRLHVSDLYPEGVAREIMKQLRDVRWGGRGRLEAQRKEIFTANREQVPVSMTASIIYEDGDEVATVGTFTDLRDRLRIERQLNQAQEELLKSEKARVAAELAGMAAHELNQPLTSVLGYAEMLRHRIPETEGKVRRHIDTIYDQAERMAEIVRKIGRITKYETTHYSAHTKMLDLDAASASTDDGNRTQISANPFAADEVATMPPRPALDDGGSQADETGKNRPALRRDAFAALSPRAARSRVEASADPRAAVVRLDTIDEETDLGIHAMARPTPKPPSSEEPPEPRRPSPHNLEPISPDDEEKTIIHRRTQKSQEDTERHRPARGFADRVPTNPGRPLTPAETREMKKQKKKETTSPGLRLSDLFRRRRSDD